MAKGYKANLALEKFTGCLYLLVVLGIGVKCWLRNYACVHFVIFGKSAQMARSPVPCLPLTKCTTVYIYLKFPHLYIILWVFVQETNLSSHPARFDCTRCEVCIVQGVQCFLLKCATCVVHGLQYVLYKV